MAGGGAHDQEADDGGRPISYMALAVGTPVLSAGGLPIGSVEHVLVVPELDVFDGVVVSTHRGERFVDRDQIGDITTTAVHCTVPDDQIDELPAPRGTTVLRPDVAHDEGRSLTAWWGRVFGRTHWKELE